MDNPYSPPQAPLRSPELDSQSVLVRLQFDSPVERDACILLYGNRTSDRWSIFWKNLFYILLWWSPFIAAMVLIQALGWQAAWALRLYAAEILLVGIITPIVFRIVSSLLRRKRSTLLPSFLNFDVELTFSPDGLQVVSAKDQLYLRWDSFTKCIRTHQGFLLLWGNNRCSMIQNATIEGQRGVERLAELLKDHIAEFSERPEAVKPAS